MWIFVGPFDMLGALWQLLPEVSFWQTLLHSFLRSAPAFSWLLFWGFSWGWASYACSFVKDLLEPPMLLIRSVPVASFVILALIWIGSDGLSVFISFLVVIPMIYTGTLGPVWNIRTGSFGNEPSFSFSFFKRLRYIYIPAVHPYLLSSCRMALGMSWKSGVAAEVIGIPQASIGEQLHYSKLYLDTAGLFAWTFALL